MQSRYKTEQEAPIVAASPLPGTVARTPGLRRVPAGGLYAITGGPREQLLSSAHTVLKAGARMLQYRDLLADPAERLEMARILVAAAREHDVPVIIDHDAELMQACGAQGVHLGAHDPDPARIRRMYGPDIIIGVSCYGDIARARRMAGLDVDYLSFGAFHPSISKPEARRIEPSVLVEAHGLGPAVVAIGGITPDNGASLIAAGADFLASLSALFLADDPHDATRRFQSLFDARRELPA